MMLISFDVGLNGGWCIMDGVDTIVEYGKMPVYKVKKGRNAYDIKEICQLFDGYEIDTCLIEKQRGFPSQSSQSVFRLGYGFGVLDAVARCSIDKVIHIEPKNWKTYFQLKAGDKKASVDMANDLYGLELKKSYDGIAESILMARYWYSVYNVISK